MSRTPALLVALVLPLLAGAIYAAAVPQRPLPAPEAAVVEPAAEPDPAPARKLAAARRELTNAQMSSSALAVGAGAADEAFAGAFGQVTQLITQADPMLTQAQTLLTTVRETSGTVQSVANQISAFATTVRGVNLTIGDLQRGAGAVGVGAQMATQLNTMVTVLGGPSIAAQLGGLQSGTQQLSAQLGDLSGLLGTKIDAHSQVYDVLTAGATRLREIGGFLVQGEKTMTQVIGQVTQAKSQLPAMQASIKTQLELFKQVAAQLNASLAKGTRELPTAAAITPEPAPTPVPQAPARDVTPVALLLLAGGLLIAFLRPTNPLTIGAAVVASFVLAGAGLAVLDDVVRADSAYAILALSALTLTALAVALLRVLGERIGVMVFVILIAAAAAGLFGRMLPSSYVIDGVSRAAEVGINSDVTLSTVVLVLLGVASVGAAVLAGRKEILG